MASPFTVSVHNPLELMKVLNLNRIRSEIRIQRLNIDRGNLNVLRQYAYGTDDDVRYDWGNKWLAKDFSFCGDFVDATVFKSLWYGVNDKVCFIVWEDCICFYFWHPQTHQLRPLIEDDKIAVYDGVKSRRLKGFIITGGRIAPQVKAEDMEITTIYNFFYILHK